ncbi:hypothetical protein HNP52_000565 [Sphingomonas kyeonggiensis]|uniref:Uncharacterized protein n=1 Tax=Sphingomonas kyeonggiensis TaxID=1268553 RepID=A0A7W7NRE4_9SPHN|nr:hypothetical protein [Sphingomonas kyeonggiensis]MBB4837514.1 hypothetical protein [Sphingomonas kyeonggiensis]
MAFRSVRFDSAPKTSWNAFPGDRPSPWRLIVAGAAIVAMLLGMAAWYASGAQQGDATERDPATLCLLRAPASRAELTLLDQTDALAAGAGQHFTRLINHVRDTLPRNGRLTIVPFGGDLGQPLAVAFDICSPGKGAEADTLSEGAVRLQRDYETRFVAPLSKAAAELAVPRESNQSPIADQILRAANDPTIGWRGEERILNLMTDGLENTPASPIYTSGKIVLPPPPSDLLRGVTVNYFELASARNSALQTPVVRAAWKAWFEAAGAKVNMYAPGYAVPAWGVPAER